MSKKKKTEFESSLGGSVGGILKGFTELVDSLSNLAEKGERLSRTGEFQVKGKGENPLKGIFGVSVKTGLGGEEIRIEPFGNVRKDDISGESVVQEVREPIVDVLEEDGYVLVIAEMPGVTVKDIKLEVKDDILTIRARRKDRKYRKEVLMPGVFSLDKMKITNKNGIVEIRCEKNVRK